MMTLLQKFLAAAKEKNVNITVVDVTGHATEGLVEFYNDQAIGIAATNESRFVIFPLDKIARIEGTDDPAETSNKNPAAQ